VGVVVLLLAFNYFNPVFSRGNSNLNQNSNVGELYSLPGDPSEEYECSPLKIQECKAKCYQRCKVISGKETCINYECNEQTQICKYIDIPKGNGYYRCADCEEV